MLVRRIICFLLQDFVQGLQSVLNGFLRRSSDGKFLCRYIEYIMFFTFQFKICPKFDNRITACPPPSDDGALPEPFSQYLLQLKQAGIQLGQLVFTTVCGVMMKFFASLRLPVTSMPPLTSSNNTILNFLKMKLIIAFS